MKPALHLKLATQLNLTPELRQSLKLLQLPALELEAELRLLLETNPLLEADIESSMESLDDLQADEAADEAAEFEPDWSSTPAGRDSGREFAAESSLNTWLHWQLNLTAFSPVDRAIAVAIIDSLDCDGYLRTTLADIARLAGAANHDIAAIETVLHRVQRFDPVGVAARDLGECLTVQLDQLDADDARVVLAKRLVGEYLQQLAGKSRAQLARTLDVETGAVDAALAVIHGLEPRPANQAPGETPRALVPDVRIVRRGSRWDVESTRNGVPQVRVNPEYERLMRDSAECRAHVALRGQLAEARWLIRALQQREDTIIRTTRAIVARQRGFLERGPEGLVSLTLKEIADDIGMHESTISRVTSGKYVQTPNGTLELKYFFAAQIATDDGFGCAAQSVKSRIRRVVRNEDGAAPLSDAAIAQALAADGIRIARRTVAKYREQLNIPPLNDRRAAGLRVLRRSSDSVPPIPRSAVFSA